MAVNHGKWYMKKNKKGMFLDAMEFWNEQSGIVISDQLMVGFFYFWWRKQLAEYPLQKNRPVADGGEAWTTSGTNVKLLDKDEAGICKRRDTFPFIPQKPELRLPVIQGKKLIPSLSGTEKRAGKKMIVVGGDFNADSSSVKNCFIDSGKSWNALVPPHGYKLRWSFIQKKQKHLPAGWMVLTVLMMAVKPGYGSTKKVFMYTRASVGAAVYFAGPDRQGG